MYVFTFLDVLPDSFDLPLFFNKEDLLELQGSPVLSMCVIVYVP